jgi:hypothetical protein
VLGTSAVTPTPLSRGENSGHSGVSVPSPIFEVRSVRVVTSPVSAVFIPTVSSSSRPFSSASRPLLGFVPLTSVPLVSRRPSFQFRPPSVPTSFSPDEVRALGGRRRTHPKNSGHRGVTLTPALRSDVHTLRPRRLLRTQWCSTGRATTRASRPVDGSITADTVEGPRTWGENRRRGGCGEHSRSYGGHGGVPRDERRSEDVFVFRQSASPVGSVGR